MTVVLMALFAAGCLETEAPTTAETSSDLTYSYTTPKFLLVTRVERLQQSADDMRALAAAAKPPLYSTWTVVQQYRSFADFANSSANKLDLLAANTYDIATLFQIVTMAMAEENRLDMIAQLDAMKSLLAQKEAMQTQLQKLRDSAKTTLESCDDE